MTTALILFLYYYLLLQLFLCIGDNSGKYTCIILCCYDALTSKNKINQRWLLAWTNFTRMSTMQVEGANLLIAWLHCNECPSDLCPPTGAHVSCGYTWPPNIDWHISWHVHSAKKLAKMCAAKTNLPVVAIFPRRFSFGTRLSLYCWKSVKQGNQSVSTKSRSPVLRYQTKAAWCTMYL